MLFQITTLNSQKKTDELTGEDLLASGAESRGVGCQPSDHTPQFIRPAKSAERVQARPLVQQVRLRVHIRRGHTAKKNPPMSSASNCGPRVPTASSTADPLRAVGSLTPIWSHQKPIHRLGLGLQSNREKGAHNSRGVYVPWRECVDPYSLGSQLACHAPSHL